MIGTKTRIWRGGMNEILHAAREMEAAPSAASQSSPTPVPAAPAEPVGPAARNPTLQTQLLPVRKPRPGTGTLVGHVFDLSALANGQPAESTPRTSLMATTRLVPIEELLAERGTERPARSETHDRAQRVHDDGSSECDEPALSLLKWRITGTHLRRGLMVVLGLATVVVFVHRQRGDEAVPMLAAHASTERAAGTASVAADAQPRAESTPVVISPVPVSAAIPSARQRAAVDALVAGDFAAARRIYVELAQSAESGDPKVFAEAARILDERIRGNRYQ
jgi:hypothetical protein